MPTTQLGGPIGPFLDRVQQRGVPVSVMGTCEFATAGPVADPAALDRHVQHQLLGAIRSVIGQKMATGQLTFRNLGEGSLGTTADEIVASAGLAPAGVQVGNLALRFAIDNGPPQREVRAQINIGGIRIHASSTGGVDTRGIANQLVNKAKSAILWYVGFAVLTAAIIGGTMWYLKRTVQHALDQPNPATVAAAKGDGTTPLSCSGSQELRLEGVAARLPATAITAAGNCKLTLVNVTVDAATAIEAGGNAEVTLEGGHLTGATLAVHATGNARVHATGTKLTGKTQAVGGAKISGL
jgi:hypothetical protein